MMDGFDVSGIYRIDMGCSSSDRAEVEEAKEDLARCEQALAHSEALARNLEESLRIANRRLWEVSSERDAYRDLATAMVQELSDPGATRRLSDPENRDGRRGFFERRKQEVAEASAAANAHLKHF
jgi:hypothetical protein